MLVVEGPSGVGKSRLIGEALDGLGDDTRLLSIRCLNGEAERYQALVQGLAQLRGSFADARSTGSMTGFEQRLQRDLRDEADRGLAVVVIDDVQWADAGTVDVLIRFLDALPSSARNPVVFASLRTDNEVAVPTHVQALLRHPATTRLHLAGLTAEEGTELLIALGAPLRFADSFAEVVGLVDGNPLLLEEMAVQLLRRSDSDPGAVMRQLEVPGSVAAEAERRIGEIAEPMRTLLGVAALAPNQPLAAICDVTDALADEQCAGDLVDDAEDEGLLQIRG